MHQQKLLNPKPGTLRGLLIVLGLVAALFLDSLLASLLTPLVGEAPSTLIFWGVGILIALWTMRRFVLSYTYALSSSLLRISFAYGRYERTFEDLYLNNIVATGDLDSLKARYPGARIHRATLPKSTLPTFAVAARDNSRISLYLLQPDDVIREALEKAGRGKKK